MKLEKNDKSILFSYTELPDVFFTEYLSQANGDFIKVYLCLVFLSKYDKEIKLNPNNYAQNKGNNSFKFIFVPYNVAYNQNCRTCC